MKLLQDTTSERKLLKSQVERRRRERMNRSLERLRNMLLQETQPVGTQRRVEKAEILEHTVLFLQNIAKGDSDRAAGGHGGRKPSFQDGISSCLQRAARFLGPEGKGLWVGAPLDASFTARVAPSDPKYARAPRRPEGSLPHTHKRVHAPAFSAHPGPGPAEQRCSRIPQQPQRQHQLDIRVESRGSKQSLSQSPPVLHTLWRPWP